MKNIIISIKLFAFLIFAGCNKVLEEEPHSFLTPQNFPRTAEEADVALFGAYEMMHEMRAFGYNGTFLFNTQNDELHSYSWGDFQSASYFGIEELTWRVFWKGVNSANNLIATLEGFDAGTNQWATEKLAEARAIRAFYYFYLVRMWGDLPLRLKPTTETVLKVPRSPATEIYSQIILPDLEFADNKLPSVTNGGGRFTRGAVKALLSDVYITLAGWRISSQGQMVPGDPKYWAMARDKAKEILDMEAEGLYKLEPIYSKLFTDLSTDVANKEIIHDVQFNLDRGSTFPYIYGAEGGPSPESGGGAYDVAYQKEWIAEQDPLEERFKWNVGNYRFIPGTWTRVPVSDPDTYGATKFQKIFPSTGYWQDHLTNWPLYRLADIKLIYAEAVNESNGGPTPEAYKQINEVRYRARPADHKIDGTILPDLTGLSQVEFREAIMAERSSELTLEGKRRFDLIRWGNLKEKVEAHASQPAGSQNGGVDIRYYLLLVPAEDITSSSWENNAGY